MIRNSLISACSLIALSACSAPNVQKFDTVSLRHGYMSCTENIKSINNGTTAGIRYQNSDNGFDVNLSGPPPTDADKFEWEKPCRDLLDVMNKVAAAESEALIAEAAARVAEATARKARAEEEVELMSGGSSKIASAY